MYTVYSLCIYLVVQANVHSVAFVLCSVCLVFICSFAYARNPVLFLQHVHMMANAVKCKAVILKAVLYDIAEVYVNVFLHFYGTSSGCGHLYIGY